MYFAKPARALTRIRNQLGEKMPNNLKKRYE